MFEWLLASIDPSRAHFISDAISWHARLMVAAWVFLIPIGIILARFFKIMPRQDWPTKLDNRFWWFSHLTFQYLAGVLILIAIWLIWSEVGTYENAGMHAWFGWITIVLCASQYLAGWLRGTKGGPTEIAKTGTIRGDHFDMTKRRYVFEYFHKSVGYICLLIAWVTTVLGLWLVNAPRWMWCLVFLWWVFIIAMFIVLQKAGKTRDTYEAIWGNDPDLPGNRAKPIGLGINRRDN